MPGANREGKVEEVRETLHTGVPVVLDVPYLPPAEPVSRCPRPARTILVPLLKSPRQSPESRAG